MVHSILLVSDIPDHVPHYEAGLRAAGYVVMTSPAIADAFARAVAERPACIVIDERVSGVRGWELCKRLRGDLRVRSVPIIVLTQNVAAVDARPDRQSGCNAWLAMPTTSIDLVEALEHVLRQPGSTPVSAADAQLGQLACPSCRSSAIRAAVRVGSVQYYFCVVCGFYWRDARDAMATGAHP